MSAVNGPAPVAFDARLISEFDGSEDVVEWFVRAELLCHHRGVDLRSVLPLRLTGGAFAVWSQLPVASRNSLEDVKKALYAAFALDEHAAYDSFTSRRLQPGESVDVFLADLRRLAALFGGVPDRALACAFISGLPEATRQTIRAGSRAEALDLASVVARARAVVSDGRVAMAAAATRDPVRGTRPVAMATAAEGDSEQQADRPRRFRGTRHPPRRCWTCGEQGHLAAACPDRGPGNAEGSGRLSAPAPSPAV